MHSSSPPPLPQEHLLVQDGARRVLFFCGGASGVLSTVLLQPLDVLKTRLQQYYGSGAGVTNPSKSFINGSINPSQAPAGRALSEFRVWSALRTIYHADGVLSLWRGVAPSLARVGLGSGTYFVALSELQHVASEHRGDGTAIHALNFATGAAARVIASTVVAPITVLKTRLEAADSLHRSGYDITRQMLRQNPLRSSFKGFVPTLCRDAPYSGLYVTVYAHMRSALSDWLPSNSSPILINFSSGAFAGLVATMVTQPFDVIKTRAQLDTSSNNSSIRAIAAQLLTKGGGGWRAFFVGTWPRVLKKALSSALTWTAFEEVTRLLKKQELKTSAASAS